MNFQTTKLACLTLFAMLAGCESFEESHSLPQAIEEPITITTPCNNVITVSESNPYNYCPNPLINLHDSFEVVGVAFDFHSQEWTCVYEGVDTCSLRYELFSCERYPTINACK